MVLKVGEGSPIGWGDKQGIQGAASSSGTPLLFPEADFSGDNTGLEVEKTTTPKIENAPKPTVTVNGEQKIATYVVSLKENKLYRYDEQGTCVEAHPVASGKKTTPTHTGLRRVTHIETYPYKTAVGTKRSRSPAAYGPKIIILESVDPKTGKSLGSNGEFIHGNNNPASIGTYASHGCVRMDNETIKRLAAETRPGSYVIIQE